MDMFGYKKTFTRLVKRFGSQKTWPKLWTLITENVTICLVAKIKISQKEASFIGVNCTITQHSEKKCCVTIQVTPAQETASEFF